jgi:hypothetical protein
MIVSQSLDIIAIVCHNSATKRKSCCHAYKTFQKCNVSVSVKMNTVKRNSSHIIIEHQLFFRYSDKTFNN